MTDWVCGKCFLITNAKTTCPVCQTARLNIHSAVAKQMYRQWPKNSLGWPPANGEVVVNPGSALYGTVSSYCPGVQILEIRKNENYDLFSKFVITRMAIHRDCDDLGLGAGSIDSSTIYFHGTSEDNVDKIMKSGFAIPCSATGALSLGRGAYLATQFPFAAWRKYARPNANGESQVVLCWATCGRTILGVPAYATAPVDQQGRKVHSTTQFMGTADARRYVCLFDKDQIYPVYRVKFVAPTDSMCFS